jgi:hypothetical protein
LIYSDIAEGWRVVIGLTPEAQARGFVAPSLSGFASLTG